MRKGFIPAFIAALAAVIAALTIGTGTALASSCLYGNPESGFYHNGGFSSAVTATVNDVSDNIIGSGSYVRGFLKLQGNTQALVVGIRNEGGGPQLYIEYAGNFLSVTNAQYGKSYSVAIDYFGGSSYQASYVIGGARYAQNATITTANWTGFYGDSFVDGAHQCNALDFKFAGILPWTTSQMISDPQPGGYPALINIGTSSFEVKGS